MGEVVDGPWSTFAAKLIMKSQARVVPIFFHGQNSRKFHLASHIAEPLRMAMLVQEAINKFNSTINLTIGDPIHWESMEAINSRKSLTEFLYTKVQDAGKLNSFRCFDTLTQHESAYADLLLMNVTNIGRVRAERLGKLTKTLPRLLGSISLRMMTKRYKPLIKPNLCIFRR